MGELGKGVSALPEIEIRGVLLKYSVEVRPRRRRPAVRYDGDRCVTLLLPPGYPRGRELEFLLLSERWILRQVARAIPSRPAPQFRSGESFPVLGRPLVLEVRCEAGRRRGAFSVREDRIVAALPERSDDISGDAVRRGLARMYAQLALGIFEQRVAVWAERMGRGPTSIRVRDYRAAWGYCRRDGSISFNWRLAQAPPEVVDYVVVHELAHLWRMDHSLRFWRKVEDFVPDYRERRRWLREQGRELMW